jgi:hypothetical protein
VAGRNMGSAIRGSACALRTPKKIVANGSVGNRPEVGRRCYCASVRAGNSVKTSATALLMAS